MTKYAHPDVLDNGPKYIKDTCTKVCLISAYSNDYATVNGANKVAEAACVTGDFALAGASGSPRTMTATITGKAGGNALQTVNPGTNMHIAFVDATNSKVLYVTEESTDQPVTSGNPVTFNSNPTYTIPQPV
jgi:ethanolamine utilization microcompartment shell protein EutL